MKKIQSERKMGGKFHLENSIARAASHPVAAVINMWAANPTLLKTMQPFKHELLEYKKHFTESRLVTVSHGDVLENAFLCGLSPGVFLR